MISSPWFGHEAEQEQQYLNAGRRRLEELSRMHWRFPGKRGPTRPPATPDTELRRRAEALKKLHLPPEDLELAERAARGVRLRQCHLRRVEYLVERMLS